MISLKLDQVLVASVRLVESLTMMWLYEVILLSCREKGRDEALFHVGDRRQFVQIKPSLLLRLLRRE